MRSIALECQKCGAKLQVDEQAAVYTCKYCHTAHQRDYSGEAAPTPHSLLTMAERVFARGEFGKAMQLIEQGLVIDPHNKALLALESKTSSQLKLMGLSQIQGAEDEVERINLSSEAERYYQQANSILRSHEANFELTDGNTNLGIEYINRSLENSPENPKYLHLKALLLWVGKNEKEAARVILEKAASINPRDIDIQNDLKELKSAPCFIATAAFGTSTAAEVGILRVWRDQRLAHSLWGRLFVNMYYEVSPPVAKFISTRPIARKLIRALLQPLLRTVSQRGPIACGAQSDRKELG